MSQLVSCSFSTIPICLFLNQRIFPFTCNHNVIVIMDTGSLSSFLHDDLSSIYETNRCNTYYVCRYIMFSIFDLHDNKNIF